MRPGHRTPRRSPVTTLVLAGGVLGGAAACDGGSGPQFVDRVVVTPSSSLLVSLGETVRLSATAQDVTGGTLGDKAFSWSSMHPGVAIVSGDGTVQAVSNGTATIRAASEGVVGSATVTVRQEVVSLAFSVQPQDTLVGAPVGGAVSVTALDALGSVATNAVAPITVSLDPNPVETSLRGTTSRTPEDGVAVFDDLVVDSAATGFGLRADGENGTSAHSAPFSTRPLSFTSVEANGPLTCALVQGGQAYCWGFNNQDIFTRDTLMLRPTAVRNAPSLTSVEVGGFYACGRTSEGVAWCWNTTLETGPVPGGLTFASLTAGCGVTGGGSGYCWGNNNRGQLGNGTTGGSSEEPVAVAGNLTFTQVEAGSENACGVVSGGEAYCWGGNSRGELGDGTTTSRPTPAAVAGDLSFARVTAGGFGAGVHNCGLTTAGQAYCWGFNGAGELGDGTTSDRTVPTLVAGALEWAVLDAGGNHTCGVTTAGAAYCWGSNTSGQLGRGTSDPNAAPTPAAVAGGLTFESVSAGLSHSCGLATDGFLYCWGRGDFGTLGTGEQLDANAPVRVAGQGGGA